VIQLYGAGRLTEAAAAAEQAVAIREKALGRGFGEALNALAIVYNRQGRNADAELLFTRVVAIWEKTLGSTHPNVALALNNLGAAYEAQGKYGQAEATHRRALKIREAVLAPDHVTLAQTYNNLANVFRAQARFDEAEALHRRPSRSMRKISAPTISRLGSRSAT
jgi:tetratricopeptide (TPR) repeat protein